jgi:hypothetical protein
MVLEPPRLCAGTSAASVEGRQDKGVAAVASQVFNVYLRAISVETKLKEQFELLERLESLEEGLEQNRGRGSRWRA